MPLCVTYLPPRISSASTRHSESFVVIRRWKGDVALLLSPREFARWRDLNLVQFQPLCDRIGFTGEE